MASGVTDYTTEQLLALSKGLGLPDPTFLRHPPMTEWSADVRLEIELLGVRSLMARDLVRPGAAGDLLIPDVLRVLVEPLCTPEVVTSINRVGTSGIGVAQLFSSRTHTTSHQPAFGGNHRLRVFETSRWYELVCAAACLADRPAPNGSAMDIDEAAIRSVFGAAVEDEPAPPTEEALRDLGVDESTAEWLTQIDEGACLVEVSVVHLSSPTSVLGASAFWMDDPGSGYWLIEGHGESATIGPVSGVNLAASIRSGLPEGFEVDAR